MPARWTSMRVNANCLSQLVLPVPVTPCPSAASCNLDDTSLSDLAKEPRPPPLPNLSNFLNPNNVYYNHTLAELYRRMTKLEKDELWMMDMLLRKAGNNVDNDLIASMVTSTSSPALTALREAHARSAVHSVTRSGVLDSSSSALSQAALHAMPHAGYAVFPPDTACSYSGPNSSSSNASATSSAPNSQDGSLPLMASAATPARNHVDTLPIEAFLASLAGSDISSLLTASHSDIAAAHMTSGSEAAAATIAAEVPLSTMNLSTWAAVMIQLSHLLPDTARTAALELVDVVLLTTQGDVHQESDVSGNTWPSSNTTQVQQGTAHARMHLPLTPAPTAYSSSPILPAATMPSVTTVAQQTNDVGLAMSNLAISSRQVASRLAVASYPSGMNMTSLPQALGANAAAYLAARQV